jgi:membrane dipeptidase
VSARAAGALIAALVVGCSDVATQDTRTATTSTTAPVSSSAASLAASDVAAPSAAPSASASAAPASAWMQRPAKPGEPARAIDMHVDTPWQVHFKGHDVGLADGQASASALRAGHYGAIVYPIYIADHLHKGHPTIADADEIFDAIDGILKAREDLLWPATKGPTPDDEHVTAIVSIEGAGAFAEDITQIDRFIARGVVLVGPVHSHDNKLATSATGADKAHGLSDLGKKLCERVYAAGGLVDVSHMSDASFDDLVPIAAKFGAPIVATHSNARAIADVPRNLTDDQLRTIAKTGGIAGLNFHHEFVTSDGKATRADVVKQALHMVEIAGIDHVGIGSDLDGGTPPSDLADASALPALAADLQKAGMSEADVQKIFSENAKRILRFAADARARARSREGK